MTEATLTRLPAAKTADQLRELIAYEEKMIGELPLRQCREHIECVKSFYIQRHGPEAAKRIHGAMKAKFLARRAK